PKGWMSRLANAHARAVADAGATKLGSFEIKILGTFAYPADALAATACALKHVTEAVSVA
ncbi:MAG: hypothetical protein ABIP42_08805, partial [Planctomycetota bacterium]